MYNVIPDSSNICKQMNNQVDQKAAEWVMSELCFANLIANLTLDTEENKTVLKQLKKANASLTQELKECKTNLDETSRALGEATSSQDSCRARTIASEVSKKEVGRPSKDLESEYKLEIVGTDLTTISLFKKQLQQLNPVVNAKASTNSKHDQHCSSWKWVKQNEALSKTKVCSKFQKRQNLLPYDLSVSKLRVASINGKKYIASDCLLILRYTLTHFQRSKEETPEVLQRDFLMIIPSAIVFSQQGLEFLFSPLLEEYYNPTHDQAEENNNDQAPNASFQEDEFINPFCTRVQEIGESSSRNIDNTDVHSFQPQSHDYRWTRDHPLEQVRGNPTMPVQTR
ncbi:hypothetical protein Tco_0972873 [Tanacetum coccineum]